MHFILLRLSHHHLLVTCLGTCNSEWLIGFLKGGLRCISTTGQSISGILNILSGTLHTRRI